MSLGSGNPLLMQRRKREFHVVIVQGVVEDTQRRHIGKRVTWLNEFIRQRYGEGQITHIPNTLDIQAGILSTGIRDAAVQLLDKVQREIRRSRAPSLLLIGYDLGGLILKQSLLIAINNKRHSLVAEKASLLIFIDTPHRVADFESWESISIKLMLRRSHGSAYQFSKVLEHSAQTLREVSKSFQFVARMFRIISFYDHVKDTSSQTLLGFPKDTSTMGLPGEASEPMDDDPLVRANLKEDEERNEFVDSIAQMVSRTKANEWLYLSCLRTLSMVDNDHGLAGPQAFTLSPEESDWILDRDECKNWSRLPGRLLWLHWRAESHVAPSLDFLEKKARETFPDANIIKFSFDSRDDCYQSTYRMLASLCHQLLTLRPALFDHVTPLYEKIGHEMPWRIDRLWVFFRSLLACPHKDHGVTCCFVNMIDEGDPFRNQFLHDLLLLPVSETPTGAFRLAVTSYKAPGSASKFAADVIDVDPRRDEDPHETAKELEIVIDREICPLFRARPELAKFDGIIRQKLRASSDAVTAILTIALLQAHQPQLIFAELEGELSALPPTTFELYQHFLDKIPTERRLWSRKVLSWIIHASQPLKLVELAIILALQTEVASISHLQSMVPQDLALDLQQVFGHLIKIDHDEVYFVHRSFRDFLLQDRPGPQESNWIFYFDDHAALAETCLRYLSLVAAIVPLSKLKADRDEADRDEADRDEADRDEADRDEADRDEADRDEDDSEEGGSGGEGDSEEDDRLPKGIGYDFLTYAVRYWPKHYNLAKHEVYPGLHKRACDFLEDPPSIQAWSWLRWATGNPLERPEMSFKNPLPVAVRLGCGDIVRTLLQRPDLDRKDLPAALEVAIENGDEVIIDDLRAAGAKSPRELHKAALYGRDRVILQALNKGLEADSIPRVSTPLHLASTSGYPVLVRNLLKAKFNPNTKDELGLAPLHLASQFGHVGVIEELLTGSVKARINIKPDVDMEPDPSTEVDSVSTEAKPSSGTELEAGTGTIVNATAVADVETKASADVDADISILDDDQWTPLHMATRWQQPGAVSTLLRSGANVEATDGFNNTPLHLAAKSGREDIVSILLSHYEALQKTGSGSETLQNAINRQDSRDKYTPLHLAAREGHTGVVQQLLSKLEASQSSQATTITDSSGNTPLHLAAENGHAGVVGVLIEMNTKRARRHVGLAEGTIDRSTGRARIRHAHESSILITNERSQTPIHLAVLNGDASVVTKLCVEHERQKAPLDLFDHETQSPLHLASRNGLSDIVSILLKHRARADIADENAETPLILGCAIGHLEIVKMLLTHGADPMSANSQGRSPLHQAIVAGAVEVAQELLRASSKFMNGRGYVNLRDNDGSTPLHLAAEAGNVQMMEVLLKEKADVKAVDGNGHSVLYLASERDHIEVVQFLIKKILEDIEDADGESSSSGWGVLEIIKALLLRTPDDRTEAEKIVNTEVPDSQDHSRKILTALLEVPDRWNSEQYGSILRLAAQKGIVEVIVRIRNVVKDLDVNDVDDEERTALLLAAQNGRSQVVEELLKIPNIDRDRKDEDGRSAISYAAELGHLKIVKSLTSGRKSAMDIETYRAALGFAAAAGHLDIVTFFLDKDILIQSGVAEGLSLDDFLDRAVRGEHDQIALLLVARGADVNATNASGDTALHLAAEIGNIEICQILLDSRRISDINARNSEGRTALFLAAWHANSDVVELLLKSDADVEAYEEEGWRPLHAAYNNIPITILLLEHDAKVDSTTLKKETPLFVAIERGYESVSKELLLHGADPLAATETSRTPLHEAAVASDDLFRLMLEHADKLSRSADPKDAERRSPLSIAAGRGRLAVVEALLDRKDVDINQEDGEGHTPLWFAVRGGYDDVVKLLLQSPKLNLGPLSETSEDLLRQAARQKNQSIMQLLLDKNIHAHCGRDALFEVAMETEHSRLIEAALPLCQGGMKLDRHGWSLEWLKYVTVQPGDERQNPPDVPTPGFLPPSRWSETDRTGLLSVDGDDEMTVFYGARPQELFRRRRDFYTWSRDYSRRLLDHRAAAVRADHPIPPIGKFIFEVLILRTGQSGVIGIGFGHKDAPLEDRMPGWDRPSWAYHGDDGKKFHGRGKGIHYAETYGEGDVIGCQIDQTKGTVSFTKNGEDLGVAFEGITGRLYPMVGMRSPLARVVARFSWAGIEGAESQESLDQVPPGQADEVDPTQSDPEYSDSGSSL